MASAPLITKEMRIEEVIKRHPETVKTFERYGLRCCGCCVSAYEDIEKGALSHGLDLRSLLDDLNRVAHE